MRIVRVEHTKSGEGPYTHYPRTNHFMYANSTQGDDHPLPSEEESIADEWHDLSITSASLEWVFGFRDAEQYVRWFTSSFHWEGLALDNFVVMEYEVPSEKVISGDRQMIFHRNSAKVIKSHDPIEFGASFFKGEIR